MSRKNRNRIRDSTIVSIIQNINDKDKFKRTSMEMEWSEARRFVIEKYIEMFNRVFKYSPINVLKEHMFNLCELLYVNSLNRMNLTKKWADKSLKWKDIYEFDSKLDYMELIEEYNDHHKMHVNRVEQFIWDLYLATEKRYVNARVSPD